MAAIPIILAVASTAMSVVGSIQQGNAQEAQYKAQAQAQEYNAKISENQAIATNQQTSAREDAERRQRRIALGGARASMAESGLTDSGSILDMFDQSAINSELDVLNTRFEGNMAARGFNEQATLDRYAAANSRSNAKSASTAKWINAGSALISGASSAYSGYKTAEFQKTQTDVWKKQGLI
jgi:roadblock/LC7 domain-containing protein